MEIEAKYCSGIECEYLKLLSGKERRLSNRIGGSYCVSECKYNKNSTFYNKEGSMFVKIDCAYKSSIENMLNSIDKGMI